MKDGVLIMQADPVEREVLLKKFSGAYDISFAAEAKQAFRTNGDCRHKVIIFDAGDAGPRDLAGLSRLKSGDPMERPIILLTSHNTIEIEKKVAGIGVFYHLIKPYSAEDLKELIQAALRYWQRTFGWTMAKAAAVPPDGARGRSV
jgi:DNA-binding NtrC family response regulator